MLSFPGSHATGVIAGGYYLQVISEEVFLLLIIEYPFDYYRFQLYNFENDFGNILFVQHSIAIVVPSVKIRLLDHLAGGLFHICTLSNRFRKRVLRINVQATQQQNNRYAQSFHNTVHELLINWVHILLYIMYNNSGAYLD